MKKLPIGLALIVFCFTSFSQDYTAIKNMGLLADFAKARTELDKKASDQQFTSKPEFFILKTWIYSALSMDNKIKGTPEQIKLTNEADAAFRKYKQMDPSLALMSDMAYQNGPVNLYSSYYTTGYNDYAAKQWASGLSNIQKAVEYSDLLVQKKLVVFELDTNVMILAGIIAENAGNTPEAAKYYSRLADNKIAGEGFESVYRYLVSYYFQKQEFTTFNKYKSLGAQLYPESEYFKYDEVDFAVGLETNSAAKLKAVEKILANDPNSFKANQVLGELIYDTLNPAKEGTPIPANADEMEKKMIAAFNKSAAAKPGYENPFIYMGDHFINKAVKLNSTTNKLYGQYLESARQPYENAAAIFAKRTSLSNRDKAQYKKAASYLMDIYVYKKIQAKGTADEAKYAAEEKKWNQVWESIK